MAAIVAVFSGGDVDWAWVINFRIEQFNARGETARFSRRGSVGHDFCDEIGGPNPVPSERVTSSTCRLVGSKVDTTKIAIMQSTSRQG
jgi:hypothetical protein